MQKRIKNIDEFNAYFHQETCHPLVAIGDLSDADVEIFEPRDLGCYCVILMEASVGEVSKAGSDIQYQAGTMFTVKPGQTISLKLESGAHPRGKILVMRPEMIENTGLGRDFYMFNFFDFEVSEALFLTDTDKRVILNCFANIDAELHADNDELTGHMLRLGIGMLLSYCKRYYERQFDTRGLRSTELIKGLDSLLEKYYADGSDLPATLGVPTVAWCAAQFHLAPNYFGNLIRRNLHISAQEYIHNRIMERAKTLLADGALSVDEVAEQLGFAYANHFSRFFSRRAGVSPTRFRKSPHDE